MKKLNAICLLICMSFISCKKKDRRQADLAAQNMMDVSYGSNAQQKMDVFLPANRNNETAVIVLLHGGGFVAGDKAEFSSQSAKLATQGFIVLNVNYRLVDLDGVLENPILHKPSAIKIASQLADVDAAVKFATAKASEWVMSTSKWAITGHSAGGTLALLYGYGDLNASRQIKVVGNWAGATNFAFNDEAEARLLEPRMAEIIYRAVGAEIKNENKLAFMAVSPFWVVLSGKTLTTINIRPEDNSLGGLPDGSKAEYQTFVNALNSKSVVNKYVEVTGADHGFSKVGNWDLVLNETGGFFKVQLNAR